MKGKEVPHPILLCALLIVAFSLTSGAIADPLQSLEDSGRLEISSYISPAKVLVPGQRIALTLEVATDSWFTGGTKIAVPEVQNLIILQTERFAANATEQRHGRTWVIQRWTLDVYPQLAGSFSIDPIAVQVQINVGDGKNASETVLSPPVAFTVTVPDELSQASSWVAAPAFSVSQRFNRDLNALSVGDAFQQVVTFEAADVLAMMLPDYATEPFSGLAVYPAPTELNDRVNRGQTRAQRSVQIGYVVEQPGVYTLRGRNYFWWNTERLELSLLSIAPTTFTVTGPALTPALGRNLSIAHSIIGAVVLLLSLLTLRIAQSRAPISILGLLRGAIARTAKQWRAWRKPALATRLNPDGSDEA